jgi:predicted ABC-type ATPase
MSLKPKFRLFGSLNGSGKTHLFTNFKEKGIIHTEVFVNADKIEAELKEKRTFHFTAYRVKVEQDGFKNIFLIPVFLREKLKTNRSSTIS